MKRTARRRLPLSTILAVFISSQIGTGNLTAQPFVFRDVATPSGLIPAASGIQGHGAGWGDVDGDGWADLYIGTFHYKGTQPNLLFRNRNGKFQLDDQMPLRISTRATGVVFTDLDNDGDLDLYVASMPGPEGSKLAKRQGHPFAGCSMFVNGGKGQYTNTSKNNAACPPAFGGRSATVLDYNGDGLLDLLVGEDPIPGYNGSKTKRSRLFRNKGGTQFEDVTVAAGIPENAAGLGVAASDVNGDGWPDIFLASTIGNFLLINDGKGKFREPAGAHKTFHWATAKGDNMICGVAIADVNGDALPDIVIGQHYDSPWQTPVANRLYLNRGVVDGEPKFDDVTEAAGMKPLPLKAPHVEIQDFDNDGRPDIFTSIVKFADEKPHPVVFRNLGNRDGVPRFEEYALRVNDFPTESDRVNGRAGPFFEKMIAERKIIYSAPAPTCDFNHDGRLDILVVSWWPQRPLMLLQNESKSGNWLLVQVAGGRGVNSMGIGSRVDVYAAGTRQRIGSREIVTGQGYASSQEAVAHFGLGARSECDVVVIFPHGKGKLVRKGVKVDQRILIKH